MMYVHGQGVILRIEHAAAIKTGVSIPRAPNRGQSSYREGFSSVANPARWRHGSSFTSGVRFSVHTTSLGRMPTSGARATHCVARAAAVGLRHSSSSCVLFARPVVEGAPGPWCHKWGLRGRNDSCGSGRMSVSGRIRLSDAQYKPARAFVKPTSRRRGDSAEACSSLRSPSIHTSNMAPGGPPWDLPQADSHVPADMDSRISWMR